MSDRTTRWPAALLTVALAVVVLYGIVVPEPTPTDRVGSLSSRIKCPVCQGEAIAESPSQIARDMVGVVDELVAAGRTDEEVLDFFRQRYGDGIVLDPGWSVRTLALWLAAPVALVVGVVLIARRTRSPSPEATPSRPQRSAQPAADRSP